MTIPMTYPKCFSYIMSSRDYQEKMDAIPLIDCKECGLQQMCIEAYNERVYNVWMDEWFEGREDDEGWNEIS